MKINELRIGNYVFGYKDHIDEICDADDLQYCVGYNPIPLTEEWLEKFGCSKDINSGVLNLKILSTNKNFSVLYFYFECNLYWVITFRQWQCNEKDATVSGDFNAIYLPLKIKFVHELQNLYFTLSGQELTIKESIEP